MVSLLRLLAFYVYTKICVIGMSGFLVYEANRNVCCSENDQDSAVDQNKKSAHMLVHAVEVE